MTKIQVYNNDIDARIGLEQVVIQNRAFMKTVRDRVKVREAEYHWQTHPAINMPDQGAQFIPKSGAIRAEGMFIPREIRQELMVDLAHGLELSLIFGLKRFNNGDYSFTCGKSDIYGSYDSRRTFGGVDDLIQGIEETIQYVEKIHNGARVNPVFYVCKEIHNLSMPGVEARLTKAWIIAQSLWLAGDTPVWQMIKWIWSVMRMKTKNVRIRGLNTTEREKFLVAWKQNKHKRQHWGDK